MKKKKDRDDEDKRNRDVEIARDVLKRIADGKEVPIPWEEAKKQLGID
jgi:hypothetical protein